MALDQRSEEEKRKRREVFEQNRAKLSLGGNQPAGFMSSGVLAQAAPKAPVVQPAQVSPQMATNIASSQRQQNIAQQQKTQLQQRATRDADVQTARQNAQKIIGLPAAQQPQAVAAMQTAVRPSVQPQPTPNIKPSNNTAAKPVMGMVPPPNSITKPAVANAAAKSVADKVAPSQSLLDDDASVLNPVYSEGMTRGNPDNKKVGLSVDNNAAVAQPLAPQMNGGNSARGFGVMAAPRKAYGEDSRRQALAMDIKPYKNGMGLTTGQIALKNSIITGDDEKYANEQYTTQMNTAQKLAQEGMTQNGANSRAQLTERGATSRAELNERAAGERQANQLGFDSEKFQQTLALDGRKLDQQKSNDQITNYGVNKLNEFRESWFNAKTPEEKTAIEEQMAILNTGSKGGGNYAAVSGGQAIDPDTGATYDLPMKSFNKDSGVFTDQPTAERAPNDPPMQALQQSGKYTKEQKGEIYDIYMNGGDISSYLE
jgi:hypothetical protein